jgi:hypothetical protein
MMAMWYYNYNDQQNGPVSEEVVRDLINQNIITPNTLVWREGMSNWQPAAAVELQPLFSTHGPPPVGPPPGPHRADRPAPLTPSVAAVNNIESLFRWFWILLAAMGAVAVFLLIGGLTRNNALIMMSTVMIIIIVIGGSICYCVMLYKFWGFIQDGEVRTTPGKAVGFLFIPFFNFYWIFPAIHGLSQDMNNYIRTRNIPSNTINEGMALTACILYLCAIIPVVGIICSIVAIVLLILTFKDMKNATIAIIQTKLSSGH